VGDDPDILVDLTTARHEFEAAVIAEALGADGVPAYAFGSAGSTLKAEIAATQPFRVQVRRRDLALAQSLLAEIRASRDEIDWDDVDVGEEADDAPFPDRKPLSSAPPTDVPNFAGPRGTPPRPAVPVVHVQPNRPPRSIASALLATLAIALVLTLAAWLISRMQGP
jgi:hypothetical protein